MKLTEKFNLEKIREAKNLLLQKNQIKFCNICGTSETKQWYADPVDTGFMCKTHYRALVYQLNTENEKMASMAYYNENREGVINRVMKNKRCKKESKV